jgi:hypothetical protein
MSPTTLRLALLAALLPGVPPAAAASWYDLSEHRWSFVAEGGARFATSLDFSGAHQANATSGWGGTAFQYRGEAWLTKPGGLNLGIVLQPFDQSFNGTLSSNLDSRGQHFTAGQPGHLNFQFPSGRITANYPVWARGETELRLGLSLIARYTEVTLKSDQARLVRTNTLALPLPNLEARTGLGGGFSAVLRADAIPYSVGLYDVFYGVRRELGGQRAVELGGRLFGGGYQPNKSNDINSKVLFNGVVLRMVF